MPFYIIVIIFSFFASLTGMQVKENRQPVLVAFSLFLFLSSVVEYVGWDMSVKYYNTTALYNTFTFFEFIFYLSFFRFVFTDKKLKKAIAIAMVFFTICTGLNFFFIQGNDTFHTYTYVLGCMLIVTFSVIYFYFLFRFPDNDNLDKNPFFWIVAGLLFFCACSFPLIGMANFIAKKIKYYNTFLFMVTDVLNVLLYTLFSIGFLCKINFRKLSGSL